MSLQSHEKAFRKTVRLVFAERTVMIFGGKCDILPNHAGGTKCSASSFVSNSTSASCKGASSPSKTSSSMVSLSVSGIRYLRFWMRIPSIFLLSGQTLLRLTEDYIPRGTSVLHLCKSMYICHLIFGCGQRDLYSDNPVQCVYIRIVPNFPEPVN